MRNLLLFSVLLATLLAGPVAFAPHANASAWGFDYWGVHTFKDIPIPSGQITGEIQGDGLNWSEAGGSFVAAGNVCNWAFKVVFYDGARSDHRTAEYEQPTQGDCSRTGAWRFTDPSSHTAKPGSVCIELYRDFGDERLGAVCHAILA